MSFFKSASDKNTSNAADTDFIPKSDVNSDSENNPDNISASVKTDKSIDTGSREENEAISDSSISQKGDSHTTSEEENVKNLPFRHYLNMEATYKYQEVSNREHIVVPRSNQEKAVTFRELFNLIYPGITEHIDDNLYLSTCEEGTCNSSFSDKGSYFLDHSPFVLLFQKNENGTSMVVDTSAHLAFVYHPDNSDLRYIHVSIKPIGSTEHSVYARICIMPPVEGFAEHLSEDSLINSSPISFIMIYDVTSPAVDFQRFLEIEASTINKMKERKSLTVFEDEVMRGSSGLSYPGYNMGLGNWLLENHRYYDAYVTFMRVFNCLKPEFFHLDADGKSAFFKSSHAMGLCLRQLGFLDKAAYYLQLAILGGQEYIPSYVEVLALACHNRVYYFLNQLRRQAQSNHAADQEAKRLEKLAADAENQNSVPEKIDLDVLSLGYVLNKLFDADIHCLLGATITSLSGGNVVGKTLDSKEDIWNFNLHEAKNSIIYIHYSRAFMEMGVNTDKSIFCQNNSLVLQVQAVKESNGQDCIRVRAMLPNFAQNDEKLSPGMFNIPQHYSFIIGIEPTRLQFSSTELKELFAEAIKLKESSRFFEAMQAFEYIHNALKVEYTRVSATEETEELFFDATCELGACLSEIGCYELAAYYLDWAQEGYKADYARDYVNCLCNSGDIRSLDIIDQILNTMQKPDDADYVESFEYFQTFLKRSKVFVLLNRGKIEDAQALLKEMLSHPISKDFAEKQLAYIDNINVQQN